jgi:hypothetical protein
MVAVAISQKYFTVPVEGSIQKAELDTKPCNFECPTENRTADMVQCVSLIAGLSSACCWALASLAREREFPRRTNIHLQGDPVRQVAILISGSAKLTQFSENGSEVILRIAGTGDLLAAHWISPDETHCSTAQAIRESTSLIRDLRD